MDANPAASPPARAPADDQSASWNPALRPDSAHAPAHPSHFDSSEDRGDNMESSTHMDDFEPSFDSPPPRTSEDRHPLNEDGPRFVFDEDDDEFSAWQNGHDDEDHAHIDPGTATPLADDRSQTPQPPALTAPAPDPPQSHNSESYVAEDSATTPVEPPASVPEPTQEETSVEELAPVEHVSPAAAEEAQPTPTVEHKQPDIETIDTEALHETNPAAEAQEEHTQEHNYEHQGETTTLEEAVQESARVPLANDTDSPALDWGASDGAFDVGSQQSEMAAEALLEPAIPSENVAHAEKETDQSAALDWGNAGDSEFDLGGSKPAAEADTPPLAEQEAPGQIDAEPETLNQPPAEEKVVEAADLDWGTADGEDFNFKGQQQTEVQESKSKIEPVSVEEEKTAGTIGTGSLDWGDAGEDEFKLGSSAAPNQEHPTDAHKVETTAPAEQQPTAPDLDWGATDDDEFGFGGATQTNDVSQPDQQQQEEPAKQEEPVKKEEPDLSAMWAEALADDDMLGDSSVDPSAFFLDDDDGFLDDTPLPTQNGAAPAAPATASKYAPAVPQAPPAAPKNPYAPQSLQTTNITQPSPAPVQASPYGVYNQVYQQSQPPQRPSMTSSAQSFADKAKGGYSSPFDLPEDLAKQPPRKKIVHAQTLPSPSTKGPPPRTSSMYSNASSPSLPPPPSNFASSPASAPSPNTPSGGFPGQPPSKTPSLSSKPSTGDFFEDLPIVQKPRPSGRYTPQVKGPTPPPPISGPPSRQTSQTYAPPIVPPPVGAQPQRPESQPQASQAYAPPAPPQRSSSQTYAPPVVQQLQQPERLNPFPDLPQATQGLGVSSAPPATSRYSPAPPGAAAATSRYSPAPPSAPAASRYSPAPPPAPSATQNRYAAEPSAPPKPPVLPFAPRTSSPLAYHSTPDHPVQRPSSSGSRRASLQPSVTSGDEHFGGHSRLSLEQVREIPDQEQKPATPPPPRSVPGSTVGSPARRTTANYTPQYQSVVSPPGQSAVPPPRRAQSQSPGATMKGPMLSMAPIDRPASTNGVTSPIGSASPYAPFAAAAPTSQPPAQTTAPQRRRRTFSRDLSYVKPTDETVNDPLERWKGAPIFKWGIGGTILTSFPKEIPRYGTGTVLPMVKCTPGEVKLQKAKDLCPLWEPIAKFPGPLKAKSQKKQVLSWLRQSIETMEKDYQSKVFNGELHSEIRIRFEEKILLWKVLEVFVEHEGHLEGSDAVNQAVRKVLSNGQDDEPQLSSPVDIMGSSTTTASVNKAEPIDPQSVEQLRAHLLKGEREKAVWEAADKRLWGHAMLISSTMNKDIWKQVVQEFVRQEVRKVSGNNQSLAALYEVFAGNWEESIDELVPASARAGFQMVSKTDRSGANTNVFEGLDRWRETLVLIVNNRSEGDPQALVALGKLLAGYGRVEAAHICYLFARSAVLLGGADDPNAHVVLIGADHINQRFELGRDIEPILLTEIFEFAVSLSAPTAPPAIPHLQAFKLAHAFTLSEYGYRTEAQAYCDAITGAMKSTTRMSPYYNAFLVQELDDLVKRLSEAPKDSSSWISKPTMGKVSSSVWSSFNKFVAGDDSDADSTGPGGNDTSPFARVAGDTPSVSRSPSTADLYGTYASGGPATSSSAIAGSRYAPSAGPYAPRTSGEQPRPRYEPATQSPYQPVRPSTESGDRHEMPMDALFAHQGTPPSSYNPSAMQYTQQSKAHNAYAPTSGPLSANSSPNPLGSPYTPTGSGFQPLGGIVNEQKPANDYEPPTSNFGPPLNSHEPSSSSYEPPSSSYEPPTSSYEPPSYQPYEPEPEEKDDEEQEEKPKKKSFMDDDDDDELERRAAALKAQQKAEADRIAEENFRKAAEADAAKASAPKKTGSWLGGWFKRSDSSEQGNKPIRAKLGEENSFYYDPDLKKWVNKKAGPADQSKPAATPPPPKGGPPLRNSASMANLAGPPPAKLSPSAATPPPAAAMRSTSMPPPMATAASAPGSGAATPSRTDSPAPPTGGPPSAAGTPGAGPPGGGPPSRPATSMSNASSIDDLLGVPAPRKGGAPKKKGRAGRYVDVMAK